MVRCGSGETTGEGCSDEQDPAAIRTLLLRASGLCAPAGHGALSGLTLPPAHHPQLWSEASNGELGASGGFCKRGREALAMPREALSGEAEGDGSAVVGEGGGIGEGLDGGEDMVEEVAGGFGGGEAGGVEAVSAEEVAIGAEGFDDAVGVEEEVVLLVEFDGVADVFFARVDAQGEGIFAFQRDDVVSADEARGADVRRKNRRGFGRRCRRWRREGGDEVAVVGLV